MVGEAILCPRCGRLCEYIGYKIPVPAQNKEKDWQGLKKYLLVNKLEQQKAAEVASVKRKHSIEKEICRLKEKPANKGREAAIRRLEKEMKNDQNA